MSFYSKITRCSCSVTSCSADCVSRVAELQVLVFRTDFAERINWRDLSFLHPAAVERHFISSEMRKVPSWDPVHETSALSPAFILRERWKRSALLSEYHLKEGKKCHSSLNSCFYTNHAIKRQYTVLLLISDRSGGNALLGDWASGHFTRNSFRIHLSLGMWGSIIVPAFWHFMERGGCCRNILLIHKEFNQLKMYFLS